MQVGGGGERKVDSGTTASQGKNILYRPSRYLVRVEKPLLATAPIAPRVLKPSRAYSHSATISAGGGLVGSTPF